MAITAVTLTGTPTVPTATDRPFTAGDGNYGRSINVSESDAPANLTGAVSPNLGLFQDMTAIVQAVAVAYASAYTSQTPNPTNQQVSPFTVICMLRDACNFALNNRSFVAR